MINNLQEMRCKLGKYIDLSGQKFGKLTVIKRVEDHITPLHPEDNRKQNLRICTQANNTINSGIQRNNKSGVTGVVWVEQINRWTAQITYQKKRIHLGSFENLEDAIKARENAEIKYFGEYRYQKSENLGTPHQI